MQAFETIDVPVPCPSCGNATTETHVQRCVGARLRSSISIHCASCGNATEEDGDRAPEAIRARWIARDGHWLVQLRHAGSNHAALITTLREILGLGISAAFALTKRLPAVIAEGT